MPALPATPDHDRYAFRRDMMRGGRTAGTAVAYSTDEPEDYAPFRGEAPCVSRSGYQRRAHELDRDGVCFWCSQLELA